jgi:hypothetical protein
MPNAVLTGLIVACALGSLALVALSGLARRAGLLSAAVPLALLPAVVGAGAASHGLAGSFQLLAFSEGAVAAACADGVRLLRFGAAGSLGALVVALLAAWIGQLWPARSTEPASARRMAVLLLLAIVPALLAGSLFEYARRTNRLLLAVATDKPPERRLDADEEEPAPRPSIASVSARLARGVALGSVGAVWLGLALLGFAATGAALAWKLRVHAAWLGIASLWLVLMIAAAAAALLLAESRVPL